MNLAAFLMVMLEKRQARRNEWHIRERTFFVWKKQGDACF
ncbi:DUF1294 domain-containing protein [Sporomusa sp. KB1]